LKTFAAGVAGDTGQVIGVDMTPEMIIKGPIAFSERLVANRSFDFILELIYNNPYWNSDTPFMRRHS